MDSFVRQALSGEYLPVELPYEAMVAHNVFAYTGEVENGGHAQFIGNCGHDRDMLAMVSEGLARFAPPAAFSIFTDLTRFAENAPDRLARCHGRAEDLDPFFAELNDRYFAEKFPDISGALGDWLRTRSWISVIPDNAYQAMIGRLVPIHPLQDKRRDLRRPEDERVINELIRSFFDNKTRRNRPH